MNNYLKKFLLTFGKEMKFVIRDRRSLITSAVISLLLTPALFGILEMIEDRQSNQLDNQIISISSSSNNNEDEFLNFLSENNEYEIIFEEDYLETLRRGDSLGSIDINRDESGFVTYNYISDSTSNLSALSTTKVVEEFNIFNQLVTESNLQELKISQTDINPNLLSSQSLQEIEGTVEQSALLLFFLPYVIIVGLVLGSLQYAIEISTGEKERKTLATTLSLNTPKSILAISKISVIMILSVFSLIMNILSIFIASEVFDLQESFGLSISTEQIFQLGFILLPLALLSSSLVIVLGLFARNQKEATLYTSPVTMGSMLSGFTANAFDTNSSGLVFLIPILGHIGLVKQILLGTFDIANVLMTFVSTSIIVILLIIVIIKMFSSEEVLFRE